MKLRKGMSAAIALSMSVGVNVAVFAFLGWLNERTCHEPEQEPPVPLPVLVCPRQEARTQPPVSNPTPRKRLARTLKLNLRCEQKPSITIPPVSCLTVSMPALESLSLLEEQELPPLDVRHQSAIPPASPLMDENAVDTPPLPLFSPRPQYPRRDRRRGNTGSVVVSLVVDAHGQPVAPEVKSSSGHPSLDRSALNAIKSWRFKPALNNGKKVAVRGMVSFNFSITR